MFNIKTNDLEYTEVKNFCNCIKLQGLRNACLFSNTSNNSIYPDSVSLFLDNNVSPQIIGDYIGYGKTVVKLSSGDFKVDDNFIEELSKVFTIVNSNRVASVSKIFKTNLLYYNLDGIDDYIRFVKSDDSYYLIVQAGCNGLGKLINEYFSNISFMNDPNLSSDLEDIYLRGKEQFKIKNLEKYLDTLEQYMKAKLLTLGLDGFYTIVNTNSNFELYLTSMFKCIELAASNRIGISKHIVSCLQRMYGVSASSTTDFDCYGISKVTVDGVSTYLHRRNTCYYRDNVVSLVDTEEGTFLVKFEPDADSLYTTPVYSTHFDLTLNANANILSKVEDVCEPIVK